VLPLENFSSDSADPSIANAVTEALTNALAQQDGIRVISRTSSTHYKQLQLPLTELARRMSVEWVIEGSIISAGGKWRVIVQVIDGRTDEPAWASSYDRAAADVLSLQSSLAPRIARDITRAIALRRGGTAGSDGVTRTGSVATTERVDRP
jgi:TolB-like protein